MVAPEPSANAGAEPERPAILIVDDEPQVTRSLARSLRDRFTVFTATNAATALDIISRERIAVILTDQRMPDISGVQLLERARDIRPDTLGILISGYTDVAALVDALNLGNVRGFLPKPWDIHQLRRQLEQAVRDYQAGFLERGVLHDTADAVTQAQAQVAELRKALDELAAGQGAALFAQWERTGAQARSEPAGPFGHPFYNGPRAETPISQHDPATFAGLVAAYSDLLDQAAEQRFFHGQSRVPDQLRTLSERLGTCWAGPRDAVEVHTAALKRRISDAPAARVAVYVEEARLLLPELMGNLVVFYRGWLAVTLAGRKPPLAP
ncbi:MAG: response regulator [Chloroflexi bacterium]|nr:response regulator [Chloroflexota bacterium]